MIYPQFSSACSRFQLLLKVPAAAVVHGSVCWLVMGVRTGHALRALSDWGRRVKPLLVPAAPVGHALLSAVGALAAASWGPEGGRLNLYGDLRGGCLSAPGSYRDHLTHRSHGNDMAPPVLWAETRSPSGGDRRIILAAAELGAIGPHPMQDGRELAGNRDPGPCHRACPIPRRWGR